MTAYIILAGGVGKRVSNILNDTPKQFARILRRGGILYSTFMLSVERIFHLIDKVDDYDCRDSVLISINFKYLDVAISQFNIVAKNFRLDLRQQFIFLVEESICNTMLATFIALEFLKRKNNELNDSILITPSDHIIFPLEAFKQDISFVFESNKGDCSLFGIKPINVIDSIKYGNIFCLHNTNKLFKFIEKPEISLIQELIINHTHYWNSGIFLAKKNLLYCAMSDMFKSLNFNVEISFTNKKITNVDFLLEKIFFCDILSSNAAFNLQFDSLISLLNCEIFVAPVSFSWIDIGSPEMLKECLYRSFDF